MCLVILIFIVGIYNQTECSQDNRKYELYDPIITRIHQIQYQSTEHDNFNSQNNAQQATSRQKLDLLYPEYNEFEKVLTTNKKRDHRCEEATCAGVISVMLIVCTKLIFCP